MELLIRIPIEFDGGTLDPTCEEYNAELPNFELALKKFAYELINGDKVDTGARMFGDLPRWRFCTPKISVEDFFKPTPPAKLDTSKSYEVSIQELVEHLADSTKRSLVCFMTLSDLATVKRELEEREIDFHELTGACSMSERRTAIELGKVVLASLQIVRSGFRIGKFDEIIFHKIVSYNPARMYVEENYNAQRRKETGCDDPDCVDCKECKHL